MMNKNIISNIFSTLLSVIAPIIIIPILISNLSVELYGKYVALISMVALVNVFADLGLGMYIPKEISANSKDINYISELTSNFLIIKTIIFLLSFVIIGNTVEGFNSVIIVGVYCYFNSLDLTPILNGLEEYKVTAFFQLVIKMINIIMVLSFDFREFGVEKAFIIQMVSSILLFILQYIFICRFNKVTFIVPKAKNLYLLVNNSKGFFFSRLLVNLYQRASVYLASFFLNLEQVALFSIGLQLYQVGQSVIGAISRVLFTATMKSKSIDHIINKTKLVFMVYILFFPIVVIFGEDILKFIFDNNMEQLHMISIIFYISLFPLSVSSFWGYPALTPYGYQKEAHYGILISSLSYYASMLIFVTSNNVTLYTFVICIVFADIVGMISRLYYVNKLLYKKRF
ncbi:TPA: oligosaccharide flippase family protein [Photobacterium damselae]